MAPTEILATQHYLSARKAARRSRLALHRPPLQDRPPHRPRSIPPPSARRRARVMREATRSSSSARTLPCRRTRPTSPTSAWSSSTSNTVSECSNASSLCASPAPTARSPTPDVPRHDRHAHPANAARAHPLRRPRRQRHRRGCRLAAPPSSPAEHEGEERAADVWKLCANKLHKAARPTSSTR